MNNYIKIPTRIIGPLKINNNLLPDDVTIPMSTFESTLWPSVSRGARVSRLTSGITAILIGNSMTRSVLLETNSIFESERLKYEIIKNENKIKEIVKTTSKFAELKDIHFEIVGTLIFIRFSFFTGDAAGHNMTTKASDEIIKWVLENYNYAKYVSISGNICVDKKVSAINGILGRGKNVIAEITIPKQVCIDILHTTPQKIVDINIKKNLIGSILAGSIRSANAHYANMLLACYLATGQDAANIVEGSQGITYAKVLEDESLYFSINCPNIIVGTIGNGKNLDEVKNNLEIMGCLDNNDIGINSEKLAIIIASAILCGELSLLAAQTNIGELITAHEKIERKYND